MVGIVASRFAKRVSTQEIIDSLNDFNDTIINVDDVNAIESILPNQIERDKLELYMKTHPSNYRKKLRSPELFLAQLISEINLNHLLETRKFKLQFHSDIKVIHEQLHLIISHNKFLKKSKLLKCKTK